LKNFRANSVFRASASCSRIQNDKKYFNTVKLFRATLIFRASVSCSKVLNDKKYILSTMNQEHTVFQGKSRLLKNPEWKNIFNTVENFRANSVFRASVNCSNILNDKKYSIQ